MRLHYEIKGMSCAACVAHVERAIRGVLGEQDTVTVSLLTNSVSILTESDEGVEALEERIERAVSAGGYTLVTERSEKNTQDAESEYRRRKRILLASILFTAALMYLSMGGMIGLPIPPFLRGIENGIWMALAQLMLTVPVLILNWKFFQNGFRALFHLSPNMDSLIAVGSGASVVYGVIAMILIAVRPEHAHHYLHDLYFEAAAMILTLVSLGKLLESRAKDKASDAVRSLATLSPKYATVLRGGKEIPVPVGEIAVGESLLIRAGEWIPVDGTVLSGAGSVDESALTGESMPTERTSGDPVRAACVLTSGALTVRADRVAKDSSLARVIRLLEDAAASKAPIARIADKVSAVFVPAVMAISAVTFLLWMLLGGGNVEAALRSAIAVLVISCPCALGLATPTAITVGIGRGARMGILFRNAESLEKLCESKTVMFDKTGTLTEGKPSVCDLYVYQEDAKKVLTLAASVERLSSHPLAQAVVKAATALGIDSLPQASDFQSLVGVGAVGCVNGINCRISKPEIADVFLKNATRTAKNTDFAEFEETLENNVLIRSYPSLIPFESDLSALEETGKTVTVVHFDEKPVAIISFFDRIREDSPTSVTELREAGVTCVMLTGDREKTAATVAKEVGLDAYHASCLPEDKEHLVQQATQKGSVAMVGDGINDAPALVRADVGVAVGAGTEIAIDCAGVVLSSTSISGVADAYFLSRATIRIIKQNLFWALFYNAICIPVAAGALFPLLGWQLSPMLASAAMSLSSVTVVTNALRLRTIHLRKKGEKTMFGKKETVLHVLRVEGMMCPKCVAHVTAALEKIKGVSSVEVDLDGGTATVNASAGVSREKLASAVTEAGYTVLAE